MERLDEYERDLDAGARRRGRDGRRRRGARARAAPPLPPPPRRLTFGFAALSGHTAHVCSGRPAVFGKHGDVRWRVRRRWRSRTHRSSRRRSRRSLSGGDGDSRPCASTTATCAGRVTVAVAPVARRSRRSMRRRRRSRRARRRSSSRVPISEALVDGSSSRSRTRATRNRTDSSACRSIAERDRRRARRPRWIAASRSGDRGAGPSIARRPTGGTRTATVTTTDPLAAPTTTPARSGRAVDHIATAAPALRAALRGLGVGRFAAVDRRSALHARRAARRRQRRSSRCPRVTSPSTTRTGRRCSRRRSSRPSCPRSRSRPGTLAGRATSRSAATAPDAWWLLQQRRDDPPPITGRRRCRVPDGLRVVGAVDRRLRRASTPRLRAGCSGRAASAITQTDRRRAATSSSSPGPHRVVFQDGCGYSGCTLELVRPRPAAA